jgi:fatty acid desaturase
VGFRFSLATESVVLRGTGVLGAFERSYRLTEARLEPWLEMIAFSVVMVLCVLFSCALGFLAFTTTRWSTWATVALFLLPLVMSVIQYAWTFFYLRLEGLEESAESGAPEGGSGAAGATGSGGAVRPAAATPRLTLVEGGKRRGRHGG